MLPNQKVFNEYINQILLLVDVSIKVSKMADSKAEKYENFSHLDLYLTSIFIQYIPNARFFDTFQLNSHPSTLELLLELALNVEIFKEFKDVLIQMNMHQSALNFFSYETNFGSKDANVIKKKLKCLLHSEKKPPSIFFLILDFD